MIALVTGSGGLIGSECVRLLSHEGWLVVGVDNDMRKEFFGESATTRHNVAALVAALPDYRHVNLDIRNRQGVRELLKAERPDFIVHTAAQPSHDKAAAIPYDDFDVNAGGTMNLLVATRDYCKDSPFCFTSTNKVYGDRPNYLALVEKEKRFDYEVVDGVDETMSIDGCLHSIFGASKVAADVMCQEFGKYFGMPIGVFRGGCLTGPQHAAVESHGYLAYVTHCAVMGRRYNVYGYKGKQVRDQIHSSDVARLFKYFFDSPRCGEVYNLGGGRANSLSILETIDALSDRGFDVSYEYSDQNRTGDHICYITDLTKVRAHFPKWQLEYDIPRILDEIIAQNVNRLTLSHQDAQHRCERHLGTRHTVPPSGVSHKNETGRSATLRRVNGREAVGEAISGERAPKRGGTDEAGGERQ